MRLDDDVKTEIRCFVYFLFKGTLDGRLINAGFDYLVLLLRNPQLVYNCFKVFTSVCSAGLDYANAVVGNYIIALHYDLRAADGILNEAERKLPANKEDFWFSFLDFSEKFCFNTLPVRLKNFDLYRNFYNCGTDALTPFIVWTNVAEINEGNLLRNEEYATRRANEMLQLMFDDVKPDNPFSEDELEAEFY